MNKIERNMNRKYMHELQKTFMAPKAEVNLYSWKSYLETKQRWQPASQRGRGIKEMGNQVSELDAMAGQGKIVLSYGDCLLRESDLRLLDKGGWINDKIIGFAFE